MNVLVIGSGGREHALAYKIKQSRFLNNLFIAPGNPGTSMLGKNVRLKISDLNAVNNFCVRNKIDLVVIGPEIPIVQGLADHLRKNKIKVFAPDSKAAEIEAHKLFAKNLMISHGIPTAQFKSFTFAEYEKALDYLRSMNYPCIVKADGLASGKGVLICNSIEEAKEAVDNIFVNKIFGSAGDKLIIEEFMKGEEVSIFAITDGIDFICLPASQDHKRIEENDKGKNTGGMGAYSPASLITDELLDEIEEKIISPTLQALLKDGRRFIGCLYAGLMITDEGPKVV
ncbi:MAG TPA: phosphoribosylamine--glycine ligase, partial [Ignavibacteria bacterium]|nr:phosphoribosylamine--glycine ligase [Ignavibacteria bacterium]